MTDSIGDDEARERIAAFVITAPPTK